MVFGEQGRTPAPATDDDQPAGFAQLRGDLGHQLAAGHANAEVEPALGPDLVAEPGGDLGRLPHEGLLSGEVKVGLVKGDRLDNR